MHVTLGFFQSAHEVQPQGPSPDTPLYDAGPSRRLTRLASMGCVASRPPVLGDRQPDNRQTLPSASRKVARQQKSRKAASYTVKDVAATSGTAAGGSGVLLQPFGSGTSQSVQSFTIGATGGGMRIQGSRDVQRLVSGRIM